MGPPRRPPLRRTLAEAAAFLSPAPDLPVDALVARAPPGDGHAVLVLPALLRGDPFTVRVRDLLTAIGYVAYGWRLGVNLGPTRRFLDGVGERLIEITDKHGPASIIGFSLGGMFARWLAQQCPLRVRQVITICSPVHDAAASFCIPLKPFLGMWPGVDLAKLANDVAQPVPVPIICLFSRDDGVVNWPSCHDEGVAPDDMIEFAGPHALIARNPLVMTIVIERQAHQVKQAAT